MKLIVAIDMKGGIGKDNKLVWSLPEDLKHFREVTDNQIVIMGRKTFESIGKPLKNRINVVLSSKGICVYSKEGVVIDNNTISSFDDFMSYLNTCKEEKWVIGGSQIYDLFMPYVNIIYLTKIYREYDCDTFFNWNKKDFVLIEHSSINKSKNENLSYCFFYYSRKEYLKKLGTEIVEIKN